VPARGNDASTIQGARLRRFFLISIVIALAVLIFLYAKQRGAAPEVPFAKVVLGEIVSGISTNGKVEPIEWSEAHAEAGGLIERTFVQKGQQVEKGAPLVQLDTRQAQTDLASAEARITAAQAELQTLRQGGRSSDVSAIESSLAAARQELAVAQREYDADLRLQAKNAITAAEVRAAKDRLDKAQLQIQAIESRRSTLINRPDITAAEGRLREAEASAAAARVRIAMLTILSPIAGTVYQFDLKAGGYLNPGDLVAGIGRLDRVRVLVYVDEPDLGRVHVGQPVTITWDAMPGRQWKGMVDRMPTQVAPLGTRQVGEVSTIIDNPGHELLPGTNVNAEIRAQVVQNAVVIPAAAIRRENGKTGVYRLEGDRLQWRDVRIGISSAARTQVSGLQEGDSVALPTDRVLKNGMQVTAVYP
jgi:HlyD family secretion protein